VSEPAPAPPSDANEQREEASAPPPAPEPVAAPEPLIQEAPTPADLPAPAPVATDVAPANELGQASAAPLAFLAVCDAGMPGCEDEVDFTPGAAVVATDMSVLAVYTVAPPLPPRSQPVANTEPPAWRPPQAQGWQSARAPPVRPEAAPPKPPPRLPIPPLPPSPGPLDLAGAAASSSSQIPVALLAALMTALLLARPLSGRTLPIPAVLLRGPDLVLQLKRPG
jgi:hypothetical protein